MLAKSYSTLNKRFEHLGLLFDSDYRSVKQVGVERARRWHSLEGLLSVAWQTWCGFCRDVIFHSCNGGTTLGGGVIAPIAIPPTHGRIAYVSKQLLRGQGVGPLTELASHQEPTWGDPRVLIEAVGAFLPQNSTELLAGLNSTSLAPEHMRCVRNAVAHFSKPNIDEVKRLSVYYKGDPFLHPLDFLYWIKKDTGEEAFLDWLEDLKDMAEAMCQ